MQHAFDQLSIDTSAGNRAPATGCPALTRRDAVLLITALPPVLLVVWLCAIQHNFQRGASAVRHAAGLGPPEGLPLFVAGSAAGFVLVFGVTIIGGTATAAGVLAQPMIWVLILLPEIAWAAPIALTILLLPLRDWGSRPSVRHLPGRRGAFD